MRESIIAFFAFHRFDVISSGADGPSCVITSPVLSVLHYYKIPAATPKFVS